MSDPKHEVIQKAEQLPERKALNPAIAELLRMGNLTPEAAEKFLAVQERWEANEARKAFTRALVELKRDLPTTIDKDSTVDYTNKEGRRTYYTHASLSAAMEAVMPALQSHGFGLTWRPTSDEKGVSVTAVLTHREGHSESTTLRAAPDSSGNKNGPQAVASTITLLQRYSALALLGITTADMKEETGEGEKKAANPDEVNTARNLKAMAELAKAGKTKAQAEDHVKRSIDNWTTADLKSLWEWSKKK